MPSFSRHSTTSCNSEPFSIELFHERPRRCRFSRTNASKPAIGFFERYLTVWVALCIVGGILLGQLLPSSFRRSAAWKWRRSISLSAC